MSTKNEISPLLIDSNVNLAKRSYKCVKYVIFIFVSLLIIGGIFVILYATSTWPFDKDETKFVGAVGKYPLHGGNMKNQQISLNSAINVENIDYLQLYCLFNSTNPSGFGLSGYITVDDEEHAYFADTSGHIKCFDITTCTLIWSVNIGNIVNDLRAASRNTLSLFQNKNGQKGVLVGTPNELTNNSTLTDPPIGIWSSWIIALDIENGEEMWKTLISDTGSSMIHGVQIDNDGFLYGGTSSAWNSHFIPPNSNNIHIGKAFKIDINTGELVNEWQTLPAIENQTDDIDNDLYYSGASIWPIQSIIDDYFVFGTGNFYTYPYRVEKCMLGNTSFISSDNIRPNNPCGEDQSSFLQWRCFENDDIYPSSLIILNKNTFELESFIKFSGVDIWSNFCEYRVTNEEREKIAECTKAFNGPDADPAAVASYHFNNELYVAVAQKSGQFYIVSIPNGELKVSKKIGPWSTNGGLAPFSMAVDENNLIAIVSFRGPGWTMVTSPWYRYKMADGTIICDAGSIHAIDLTTGYTMWQWINPYAKMGINECNSSEYDNYIDPTVGGTCQRAFDGSEMLLPNVTIPNYNGNVIIPPIDELTIPYLSSIRALNIGPVTISNDMVFIPTMTGEIFIHHIFNGEYIKTLTCPDYVDNNGIINRQGIRSGITIYDDKLMFYCGSDNSFVGSGAPNGQIIVMSLRF
eukprot:56327_1